MFGEDPMFLLAAGAAFVSIAGVGWVLSGGGKTEAAKKRVKAIAATGGVAGRGKRVGPDANVQRRKLVQDTLKDLEAKQKKARKKTVTLKAQIAQAGFDFTVRTFWIASGIMGLVAIVALLISGKGALIALAGGVVGGLGLPRWFIMLARGRRMKKFTSEFANSIDVIVRGIKTGLPLNECLKIIANEAPEPICTEFHELVESQTLGVTLEDALKRMYQRMPLQEVNFFAVVLAIQQKTGGNLAEALSNLSGVLRSRKLMREKIAALSSEAKASALIIGSLPPGVMAMVYVTTPDYMSLMFTDNLGRMMLMGGLMWMGTGIFVMKKMVSFKI